jgi:CubicO group peptidase (beta-lactamase class C family)
MTARQLRALACTATLLVTLGGICRDAAAQRAGPGDERVLEEALVAGIAMGIPGISVAIGLGDSLLWAGTAGYSDLSRRVPVKAAREALEATEVSTRVRALCTEIEAQVVVAEQLREIT